MGKSVVSEGAMAQNNQRCESIDAEQKVAVLQNVLVSKTLSGSQRCRALLDYLGNMAIFEPETTLTAYDIAFDVFGRGSNFDPEKDSIVRVHMNRLREYLEKYYATEGSDDEIYIDLPLGTSEFLFKENTKLCQSETDEHKRSWKSWYTHHATNNATAHFTLLALLYLGGFALMASQLIPFVHSEKKTPEMARLAAGQDSSQLFFMKFKPAHSTDASPRLSDAIYKRIFKDLSKIEGINVVATSKSISQIGFLELQDAGSVSSGVLELHGSYFKIEGFLYFSMRMVDFPTGDIVWRKFYKCPHAETKKSAHHLSVEITTDLKSYFGPSSTMDEAIDSPLT